MLKLENISKNFNGREVLKGLSGSVVQGDFVIIMGPNGTGKSTLFDIISGKTAPDSGSIWIDDVEFTHVPEKNRAIKVGRLFQNTYVGSCATLTIRENLAMATLRGRKPCLKHGISSVSEEVIEELLKPLELNLEHLLDVPMGALSGGQRQIVSFVMATMKPPSLLLLDEPTAALDPIASTKLLTFAAGYAERHKIPMLLITHDPMIARHLGNRLWIVEEGRISREFGLEKREMNPQDFFHHIDYEGLQTRKEK